MKDERWKNLNHWQHQQSMFKASRQGEVLQYLTKRVRLLGKYRNDLSRDKICTKNAPGSRYKLPGTNYY
jgi:hypothetical protein